MTTGRFVPFICVVVDSCFDSLDWCQCRRGSAYRFVRCGFVRLCAWLLYTAVGYRCCGR